MQAAILTEPKEIPQSPLKLMEVPKPAPKDGQILLRVRACGVCRTDLHIVEGELPHPLANLIPGHQIVGEVVNDPTAQLRLGMRVGVSWIGGTDGSCRYCHHDQENHYS